MKIIKHGAASAVPASVDFAKLLPSGQVLQNSSAITIATSAGVDVTSAMLVSTTLDTTKISGIIQAGTVGLSYVVTFTAITQSYTFVEVVDLIVESVATSGTVSAATNAIISLGDVKDFLAIPSGTTTDDDFLQTWINYHSGMIEDFGGIDNKVKLQDVASEILNGTGRSRIRTNYYPIYAIGVAASTTDAAKLASVQYLLDGVWTDIETDIDNILIINPPLGQVSPLNGYCLELTDAVFPEGTQNIKLSYQAGWSTVPAALVMVCLEMTVELYRNSSHRGGDRFGIQSQSQSMGGGSANITYKDFSERHLKLMKPFMRKY